MCYSTLIPFSSFKSGDLKQNLMSFQLLYRASFVENESDAAVLEH